jgi:mersacidin/lichenicidin family type 2 lantibiotic
VNQVRQEADPVKTRKELNMSTEEIIHAWKNELQLGKKPARALHSSEEPETEPGKAPANPAGDQELSDEELALIEGGDGNSSKCSCEDHSCTKLA